MENQFKSETNKFIADWQKNGDDAFVISKDGTQVATLVWDGGFSLNTGGEVDLDPEDLIELCDFVNGIKIDLYTEFPND